MDWTRRAWPLRVFAGSVLAMIAQSCNLGGVASGLTRYSGKMLSPPGIMLLTGAVAPELPELADPYISFSKEGVLLSGTASYSLRFGVLEDLARGGPFDVVWG